MSTLPTVRVGPVRRWLRRISGADAEIDALTSQLQSRARAGLVPTEHGSALVVDMLPFYRDCPRDADGLPERRLVRLVRDGGAVPVMRAGFLSGSPEGLVSEVVPWSERQGGEGTPFSGGIPDVEQRDDLKPYEARGLSSDMGAYERVYHGDPVIFDGANQVVDILCGATWEWEAPSVDDRMARVLGVDAVALREQLERAADVLNVETLMNPAVSWPQVCREQVMGLAVKGFAVHEFGIDAAAPVGRRTTWMEHRGQNTVGSWICEPGSQRLVAIQQDLPWGSARSGAPVMDARKLAVSANLRVGANFEGIALIRPAIQFHLAGVEWVNSGLNQRRRFGAGIPVFRRDRSVNDSQDLATSLHRAAIEYFNSPEAYVSLPPGVTLEVLKVDGDSVATSVLEYFDSQKRQALGSMVFWLGSGNVGSFALSDVLAQLYLKRQRGFAEQIGAGFSAFGKAIVDMTVGAMPIYPTLTVRGILQRGPEQSYEVLRSYLEAERMNAETGAFTVEQMDTLREAGDLPLRSAADLEAEALEPEQDDPEVVASMRGAGRGRFVVIGRDGEELRSFRALRPAETHVAWRALSDLMDAGGDAMTKAVEDVYRAHRREFVKLADPLIASNDQERIAELRLDFTAQYERAIMAVVEGLEQEVEADAEEEMAAAFGVDVAAVQRSHEVVTRQVTLASLREAARQRVVASVREAARRVSDRMMDGLVSVALSVANGGARSTLNQLPFPVRVAASMTARVVSTTVNAVREEVGVRVQQSLGRGQARVQYSAILDESTCTVCEALDGSEFVVGSVEYERNRPPNERCLSNLSTTNRCRCVYVYLPT